MCGRVDQSDGVGVWRWQLLVVGRGRVLAVSVGPVRRVDGSAERDVQRSVQRGAFRQHDGVDDGELHGGVHAGVHLCGGLDVTDGSGVRGWQLQHGRRVVLQLQRGLVRQYDSDAERQLQWAMRRRSVWECEWVDDVKLQRAVHGGLRVHCGLSVDDGVDLSAWHVLADRVGRVPELQCGSVRRDGGHGERELQWPV